MCIAASSSDRSLGAFNGRIAAIQNWLAQHSQKSLPFDTFPFEVISPYSSKVVQQLSGSNQAEDDPLADFNIPYQAHRSDYNIQNELEKRLKANRWLLILGRTGLGKTREASELANRLNQEGWTVLKLKNHEWLEKPVQFPADRLGQQPKLLFFLDNLNQAMVLGRTPPAVEPDKLAQPLKAPLQERLMELLKFYESSGAQAVWVIATARDETKPEADYLESEWEKLEIEKYPKFWQRFEQYPLPEPDEQAVINVLADRTVEAKITAEVQQFEQIALRNDRTFRNVIENLVRLKNRGLTLNLDNYTDSLKGTWLERYQNAVKRYPVAQYIYDAIDLLQQVNVELYDFTVIATAQLLANGNWAQQLWRRQQIHRAFKHLVATERILQPRDGQIEAKGRTVEVGTYIPRLSHLLLRLSNRYPNKMQRSLLYFSFETASLNYPQESLASCNRLLKLDPTSDLLWFGRGCALSALGRHEEALSSYDQALQLKPEYHQAWYNKACCYSLQGNVEKAVETLTQAIELNPKYREMAKTDTDFDSIRDDERFRALVNGV